MQTKRSATFYLSLAAGPFILALGLLARFWPPGFRPACLTHTLTGFPCPGCGSYRALCLFVTGRWTEALVMQPLMTLAFTALALLTPAALLAHALKIPPPRFRPLSPRERRLLILAGVTAVLVNWLYLVQAGR